MFYHGVFVSAHVTVYDELIPILKRLQKALQDNTNFYLTPELIEYFEKLTKESSNKNLETLMSKLVGRERTESSSSDSSSSSSSSSDSEEEDVIDGVHGGVHGGVHATQSRFRKIQQQAQNESVQDG